MTAPAFDTPLHIHHGDCIDYLAGLPGGCIDLVVTDPPYGIEIGRASCRERVWLTV